MTAKKINVLIKYLLSLDSFTTASHIAHDLGFSERSIHNYLNSKYFKNITRKATLEKIQNKGILLYANDHVKNEILSEIKSDFSINPSISDDILEIVIQLLLCNKKADLKFLSSTLFRSESSIQRILKEVEAYVAPFSCEVKSNRFSGFYIDGQEKDIRSLFLFSLKKIKDDDRIYYNSRLSADTQYIAHTFLSNDEMNNLLSCIDNIETATSYFCDTDFNLLIYHLIILVIRVRKNNYIQVNNEDINFLPEFQSAMLLKVYLEKYFNIALNEDEVRNLTLIIISLRKQVNSIPAIEEHLILNKFISLLSEKLNTDLNEDYILKQNLITHLRPTMNRLKMKTYSKNPILSHIKNEYTDVYIAVLTTIEELEENNDVYFDSNEIGYLCLHIIASLNKPSNVKKIHAALICNEGLSVEQYFKNLIETNFPTVNIKNIIRFVDARKIDFNKYDIVFNTTSLYTESENIFDISANISDFELNRINIHLSSITKNNLANDLMANNLLLFFKDNIDSQEQLLKKYSRFLFEHGYVKSGFLQSVLDRQKISSTYISRGIAVPHGSVELVNTSVIVIIILDNTIKWDNDEAQIVLFIISNNEHVNSFNQLLRSVLRVASSDQLTNQLKGCNNKKEVIHILSSA